MVHWAWLMLAFLAGGVVGVLAISILVINRDKREYDRGYEDGLAADFKDLIRKE